MIYRLIEWAWGHPLGKLVKVKSWRISIDAHGNYWQDWGIGWPVLLIDRIDGSRYHSVPIWNFTWLRNRLGFPQNIDYGPM